MTLKTFGGVAPSPDVALAAIPLQQAAGGWVGQIGVVADRSTSKILAYVLRAWRNVRMAAGGCAASGHERWQ